MSTNAQNLINSSLEQCFCLSQRDAEQTNQNTLKIRPRVLLRGTELAAGCHRALSECLRKSAAIRRRVIQHRARR